MRRTGRPAGSRRQQPLPRRLCPLAALALALLTGCPAAEETGEDAGCAVDGPYCERNTLHYCDDAGVQQTEDCGEQRCASDAPTPACVDPAALPCDPETSEPSCLNGLLRACDEDTLYPADEDCGSGRLCREVEGESACRPLGELRCDAETWVPLCVGGRRITCDGGALVERPGC